MTSLVAGPPSSENNFEPKIFIEFDRNKYSKLAFEIVPLFSYFVKVPENNHKLRTIQTTTALKRFEITGFH